MASHVSFALHPEFDAFLFAGIGEEQNGMTLTVVSALARRGVDPWAEAARLAALPKIIAGQVLAPLLARLPVDGISIADTQAMANRLVKLLPMLEPRPASGAAKPIAQNRPIPVPTRLVFAALLAILLLSMFSKIDLSVGRLIGTFSAIDSTQQPTQD